MAKTYRITVKGGSQFFMSSLLDLIADRSSEYNSTEEGAVTRAFLEELDNGKAAVRLRTLGEEDLK